MVDTNRLRGLIAEKGLTQGDVAKTLGIAQKTFSAKMKRGVFLSNEMEDMIELLEIEDPARIFFAKSVTQ